ncbi:conserved hypothetical protein [Leishmania infantum JPCM5]|uniref:Uncharacterized protein n=2 Tax=Leishmania infantum TaxID=5671 RepID=A4IDM0_LEIIN|nr:conserved hypothetical protein [Leishmania infantum JPCM5]CAC9551859.1 hypothetical_protein_-_conserved [Leishmania infantum]CAM72951.1 conserved hypothetical protein [Leishmania infantum JPCM5]SUZ46842.1 hypothetical_protein_-_conserved [Leishmania infantum]|eukprot:XP_001469839.1 conserved hypothetical protein [Leishmania infantum JPCM5]
MRRAGWRAVTPTAAVVGSTRVSQALALPSSASSWSLCDCSYVSAQCRFHHAVGLLGRTRITRFDLRKHEMEKRRLRELEKAGIDPTDDDDAPWIAPEEQQRLDEEEERRRAEMEEQRQAFIKKRAEEDAVKRQKFKEFRAKQIAMSRHRKEAAEEKKEEARQHRQQTSRVEVAKEANAAEDGADAKDASHHGTQ